MRLLGGVVLPIVFIGLLTWYLWRERDQLDALTSAPIIDLAVIGLLVIAAHFLNSTEFWVLYRLQGVPSTLMENWFLFMAGHLANYLPAQAGALYRLRYMRVVHGVAYSASAAVYGVNLLLTFGGAAVAGLVGVIGLALSGGHTSWSMLAVYTAFAIGTVAAMVLPLPRLGERRGKIGRALSAAHEGFDTIRRAPRSALAIVLMEAVKYVLTAARFLIAFRLLGDAEPFWFYLALAPSAGLARMVAITPGAIGVREAFIASAALALGSPLSTGLLAATVDRAVMLVTSVILGAIGFAGTYPRLVRANRANAAYEASRPIT
jgi:uncharacterized membrane protein YbhN (UPF0104 family)